jgi:hypothetical protein
MTNWLELTTDEMLSHLKEVFYDYKVEPVTGKWTKFEVRKKDIENVGDRFRPISVYTYSDPIDEKCKWYFSFKTNYTQSSPEIPVEIGISEYYKYLYENLMDQEELTRELTREIFNIGKNKDNIRDWKLNNLGI